MYEYIYIYIYVLYTCKQNIRKLLIYRHTAASYVYSFVIRCSPLGVFGLSFPLLGPTLDSFWVPFGSPWPTLERLGCHGDRLGLPGGMYKVSDEMERQIPSKWHSSAMPVHKK